MRPRPFASASLAFGVCALATFAACSGSGGTATTAPTAHPSATPSSTLTPTPTATPTPTPSPSPSSSANPLTVSASPNPLDFYNVGASYTQNVTVTQVASPNGPFTTSGNNAAVATVAAGGSPNVFIVTPVGPGTTTITITGTNAMTTAVTVNVTTTPLTVSKVGAK